MTKPLNSLGDHAPDALIKYQPARGLVASIEGPPLALPGPSIARRDPPGGGRSRHDRPLSVTPYSHFGMTRIQKKSRTVVAHRGVGGEVFFSVPRDRALSLDGVRT